MHRCLIEPTQWDDPDVRLTREESHHLFHVLRARPGDTVQLFDGAGREAAAVVRERSPGASGCELQRSSRVRFTPPSACAVTLFLSIPRSARMDLIVEKATELGVHSIVPMLSERSVARPEGKRSERRHARWQRIACSATRQSGRAYLPEVHPIVPLDDAVRVQFSSCDLLLLGALGEAVPPVRTALADRRQRPSRVGLIIGPEGDFSEAEIGRMSAAGAIAVSFGPRVLRVETAVFYGISVLLYELSAVS